MLDINGIEYLTYYISKNRDNRYIMSVVYDIQKEQFSDNIIILVEESVKINKNNFQIILAIEHLVCYSVHNKRGKRRAKALDNK